MDEISEQLDRGQDLASALGQQIGPIMDDDELTQELSDMLGADKVQDSSSNAEMDQLVNNSLGLEKAGSVPQAAPVGSEAPKMTEEEKELQQLMASMET